MLVNLIFLPILFFIGLVTSYEDLKYGKIRNKWIMLGLTWGLGALLALFILSFFRSDIISLQYIGRAMLNFILAIVVSFLMWKYGAWAAGDAKLFITYSLLIPLTFYWKSYLPLFPAFALLVNIFFIIFVYLLLAAVIFFLKYFFVKWFRNLNVKQNDRARVPFDFSEFFSAFQQPLGRLTPFVIAKRFIRALFRFHGMKTGRKEIKIDQLEKNMTLCPHFINEVFKEELEKNREEFGVLRQDGLSQKQVDLIKKWAKEKNIGEVKILKTFPFAIWMFVGVLLTLAFKMSVINLIIEVYRGA